MPVHPIVFVHGITGSWLKDQYPVDYDDAVLWTGVLKRNYDRLELSDLDADVDDDPRRFVFPHQAVPLAYEGLVHELREESTAYTYVFTYDWRKDNRASAAALGRFVDLVLRKVGAHERKAGRRRPTRVVLIGHSMGGLVIRWYVTQVLKAAEAKRRVHRVFTVATPFRGSLKSVEALLPGARNLFGVEHRKSMRHASRTMPGVYQLLPTWEDAVVTKQTGEPLDIFTVSSWQDSLVRKMERRFPADYFARMLEDAARFTGKMSRPLPEWLRRRWYSVFGEGSDTWCQVKVDTRRGNFFEFDEAQEDERGDGTVHAWSSVLDELAGGHRHRDKRHHIRDLIVGHHANMCNHAEVQDWILGKLDVNPHAGRSFRSPI